MATEIRIANLEAFQASLREAQRVVGDLREPFQKIRADWLRTNRTLFSFSGPGPWRDLSGAARRDKKGRFQSPSAGGYKAQKLKKWGFVYPILKASGRLERSVTEPGAPGAYFEIVGGTTLRLGTTVTAPGGAPYPYFLQVGTRFMPSRPFLEIPELSLERWKAILRAFIVTRLTPGGGGPGRQA